MLQLCDYHTLSPNPSLTNPLQQASCLQLKAHLNHFHHRYLNYHIYPFLAWPSNLPPCHPISHRLILHPPNSVHHHNLHPQNLSRRSVLSDDHYWFLGKVNLHLFSWLKSASREFFYVGYCCSYKFIIAGIYF